MVGEFFDGWPEVDQLYQVGPAVSHRGIAAEMIDVIDKLRNDLS